MELDNDKHVSATAANNDPNGCNANADHSSEHASADKVDAVAKRILEKYRKAFEELAK